MSFSLTAQAETSCREVISKCDDALAAKNKQISKLELGLTQCAGRTVDLQAQIQSKNEQLQAFYRNPFVMLALGAVAGVAVIEFVKK